MLCCIAEIAMFVFGIIALVKGSFKLSANKIVQGGPARVIGVILLLPLILGQGGGVLVAMAYGIQVGARDASDLKGLETTLVVLNIGVTAVTLLAAIGIAAACASPEQKRLYYGDQDHFGQGPGPSPGGPPPQHGPYGGPGDQFRQG
jgi:hypothetical protein